MEITICWLFFSSRGKKRKYASHVARVVADDVSYDFSDVMKIWCRHKSVICRQTSFELLAKSDKVLLLI